MGDPRWLIEDELGEPVLEVASISGGCVVRTFRVTVASGKVFFAKLVDEPALLRAEARGLRELYGKSPLKIPKVILQRGGVLILEFIPSGRKNVQFFIRLGEGLARLHENRADAFGFPEDNFIGSTPQINRPLVPYSPELDKWPEFFHLYRLEPQVRLAHEKGYGSVRLRRGVAALEKRLGDLLGETAEPPSLLHGDLWSGNYIVDEDGQPCLIDPAVYYGHREADLAMTRLFGGFSPEFYESYHKILPVKEEFDERAEVYNLYHLLNHLNLFGGAYQGQVAKILSKYL